MRFKAAVFDMDGTLTDSMPVWDGVWEEFLVRRGLEPDPNITSKYKALTLTEAADYYRVNYGLADTPAEICGSVNALVREGYANVGLKPGVSEYLKRLSKRGVRMCVATNTARELVEYLMGRLGITEYFDFILPCAEFGSGKAKPDIFYECARRLGAGAGETCVFEDAPHALKTAHDAGFLTAAIWDSSYAGDEALLRSMADKYIFSFDEME